MIALPLVLMAIPWSNKLVAQDSFSQNAINTILGDLKQEIVNGSNAKGTGATTFYTPKLPENMLPVRSGNPGTPPFSSANPDPIPNLIRRSVKTDPIPLPGVASRASDISSSPVNATTAAQKGQISFDRWNKHLLIPRVAGATPTQTTPVANFIPPDWVFVTSQGPKTIAAPDTTVVGRYAYAIYDEGGLLDVNVAGYPSVATPDQIGSKPALAYADLTQTGMSTSAVDDLVGWRNYASTQVGGMFPNYTFTSLSGTNYYNYVLSNTNGFLQPSGAVFNGQTDHFFTSRQQLIAFQNSTGFAANALQYLGTFSRTVDRPTFQPDPNRPKILYDQTQGGSNAIGLDDVINPGARNTTDGSLLAKRRFALDNLKLLEDPVTNATRIKDLFGLTRSGNKWVYNHGRSDDIIPIGSTDMGSRKGTPDFFETLKAAIHVGSLGVQHGTEQTQYTNSMAGVHPSVYPARLGGLDADINYQIIKIGANIIDQYDGDSYPTVITFNGNDIYGSESLPGICALQTVITADEQTKLFPHGVITKGNSGWDPASGGSGALGFVKLLMPRLWNPYVTALVDPLKSLNNFKISAKLVGGPDLYVGTGSQTALFKTGHPWANPAAFDYTSRGGKNYGPGASDNPATDLSLPNGCTINFTLPSDWTSTWPYPFSDPRTLYEPNYPVSGLTISAGAGRVQYFSINEALRDAFNEQGLAITTLATPYTVFGFPLGRGLQGPVTCVKDSNPANNDPSVNDKDAKGNQITANLCWTQQGHGGLIKVTLSCDDGAGGWLDYDSAFFFAETRDGGTGVMCQPASTTTNGGAIGRAFTDAAIRFDPRTNRWGSIMVLAHPMSVIAKDDPGSRTFWNSEWSEGRSLGWGASSKQADIILDTTQPLIPAANKLWSPPVGQQNYKVPTQSYTDPAGVTFNRADSPYQYKDPDGVQRRAMGAYWTSGSVDGQPQASSDPAAKYPFSTTATVTGPTRSNRAVMLNRPFRSITELGQVFRDTPWKNLDFFTVESGDSALLDFFCVHATEDAQGKAQTPLTSDGSPIVAGKVNLNTRQPKVLSAMINGVLREENSTTGGAPFTTVTEVDAVAQGIVDYVHGATNPHKFRNLSELVGYPNSTTAYEGFADKLGTLLPASDQKNKQRREAVLRALTDGGQTSTWNLMIDIIAQAGQYPNGAANLNQFLVSGSQRYWLHVAIDRYTGQIVDQSLEAVPEIGPTAITLANLSFTDNQAAGTIVSTISATDATPNSIKTYSLVDGIDSEDNAAFTVSGSTLLSNAVFEYLTKSAYKMRLCVTNQNGLTFEQPFTIQVLAGPYTQWKISNFGENASNPAVGGDTIALAADRVPNLIKYALGMMPYVSSTSSLPTVETAITNGTAYLNYTYKRSDTATDVTVLSEWSTDLSTWSNMGIVSNLLSDDGISREIKDSIPSESAPKLFMRLKVIRP